MNTNNQTKINRLLQKQPSGTVFLSSWMEKQGISRDLQKRYKTGGWLESIGTGAMIRKGDKVNWLGALYSLQQQLAYEINIGGRTALSMQGKAHYLEFDRQKIFLFAPRGTTLPAWFKKFNWGIKPVLYNTNFLPSNIGLSEIEEKSFSIKVSSPARALLECLYLTPQYFNLTEAYQLLEGMATLRPIIVQQLLENCNSIKVVRLFLYMADKSGHTWFKHLDLHKMKLGNGKRSLVNNGIYIPEYQITVPAELINL